MRTRRLLALLILLTLCAAPAWSQSGTATNVRKGSSLPASCTVGQIFFLTSGTIGLYGCTATNTWSLGGSASGNIGGSILLNQIAVGSGTNLIGGSSALTSDGVNPARSTLGVDVATNAYDVEIANNASTGTTLNRLACNDGTGKVLVCAHTTSTTNQAIGSVVSGAGTTGNATLCTLGFCTITFDNASTALHYAIASSTVDGELHDVGTSLTSGQPNYLVWTANAGAGTTSQYRLLIGDDFVTGSNTGVVATGSPTTNQVAVFSGANSITGINTTGSGSAVLATSPALTTPNLGTPSAINLSNATALPCTAMPSLTGAVTSSSGSCATSAATKYTQWLACDGKGIGDGLNAMAAGTYLMTTCRNTTGVTVTITGLKCFTDNNGTSTLNASGQTLGALLTGAVTCTTSYASGTQSANVSLTANDYINFTFVADGTSKQTDWVITGTF